MLNPSLQKHTLSPRVLVLTHTTEPFSLSLSVESFPTGTPPCLPAYWYSPTQLNPSPSILNPSLQQHTLSPRVLKHSCAQPPLFTKHSSISVNKRQKYRDVEHAPGIRLTILNYEPEVLLNHVFEHNRKCPQENFLLID